jgi:DNA-binding transcriptional ArsR family regulator
MSNLRKASFSVPAYVQALRLSADIMRALAHPLRLQIITFIDGRESACVSDIHAGLNIEQSLVSQHLRVLRQAGLVQTARVGKFVHYTLNYDRLEKAGSVATSMTAKPEAV